ncbi:HNH endonuclease [Cohnella sp. GCM10027633]|uniref:HNH endonuclease n=1 Tax=unclassified Cohnella TaxID=2636738 RepID=UPI00363E89FD
MLHLPAPTVTVRDVFSTSISNVQDADLKRRLEACLPEIEADTRDYESKAPLALLHTINRKTIINGNVTKDEMENVYTYRMVQREGRDYYTQFKRPIDDVDTCPFCGHFTVRTLDHYLPKAKHPSLAVTPTNLVPSCWDCNTSKNARTPARSEEETLHPYFDNINDVQWLFGNVRHTEPVGVRYIIRAPVAANPVLASRVQEHFVAYNLGGVYSSQAGSKLRQIAGELSRLLQTQGSDAVRLQLMERAESCLEIHRNSWEGVLYQALAADDWYCSTGVLQQPRSLN